MKIIHKTILKIRKRGERVLNRGLKADKDNNLVIEGLGKVRHRGHLSTCKVLLENGGGQDEE